MDLSRNDYLLLKDLILAWRESGDVVESGAAVRFSGLVDSPPEDRDRFVSKFNRADVVALQQKARKGGPLAPKIQRASELIAEWLDEHS